MKSIYGIKLLRETLVIETLGLSTEVELSWNDGMIGAMPVFKDYKDAIRYASGDEDLIFKLQITGDKDEKSLEL